MSHAELIPSLSTLVGSAAVLTGESAAPYSTDWRGRYSGNALAVVLPSDTRQVAEVVKLCVAERIAIVPQGGAAERRANRAEPVAHESYPCV